MTNAAHQPADVKLAVIGLGHMNTAIVAGYVATGAAPAAIQATTHSIASATAKSEKLGITVVSLDSNPEANRQAVAEADVVLVGTKPADIVPTLSDLAPALPDQAVVVSVAAGITLQAITEAVGADQPVVRCMPNLPLTLGKGVVGMAGNQAVTDRGLAQAEAIFSGSGRVFHVPEDQINLVAAIAGSGPGYIFHITDVLAQAGAQLGLDPETAVELARLTVSGAGAMLGEDGADPKALTDQICTPGGTTEAAVNAMDDSGLQELLVTAVHANIARSEQIANS